MGEGGERERTPPTTAAVTRPSDKSATPPPRVSKVECEAVFTTFLLRKLIFFSESLTVL